MTITLTRQPWIFFLSVIGVTLALSLQAQLVYAEGQTQNKTAPDKSKVTKIIDAPDQKQASKQNETHKNKLPVEPIIEEMKRAGKLIENQQTGEETQKIQQQVVQNLEDLIRLIETTSATSRQQLNPNNDPQSKGGKKSRQQKSGARQKNVPQLSQGPARQSSERKEAGQSTPGSLTNRNVYIKDAWGHLPPAMRQQLLNIYTEKFLPQYENQVRRYYEALAEQKKRTP